jgi:pyruvate dehydrogenase E2 component (dihydrolipoamide acetyltransferase)
MARTMAASASTAVHVTIMEQADALALRRLREREHAIAADRGLRLTWFPFIVKALTLVLERFPLLNSSLDQDRGEIILHRQVHIGFAVDTPDGLLVPVVRNTRQLSILELAAALQDLALRARERQIGPGELKGGTFTVSNYGALGGIWGTPIINPPEAAILGIGRIDEVPVVRDGQVVARPVVPLSLTFDHRIIDGATAHRFLNALIEYIENPDLILLET